MSYMSELSIALQDAIISGQSFEDIAAQYDVPLEWVLEAEKELLEYESDGQPDEAQEWYDFDPAC